MEKKLPQIESFNTTSEETIQNKKSEITQNSESIFCFQKPINKKTELATWALQESHFAPFEGNFQNENTKSVVSSIIPIGSTPASSSWVVSNQYIHEIDKFMVGNAENSPVFLGDHLSPFISKHQWAVTNIRDLNKSVFQIENANSVTDTIIHRGSHSASSPWVVSNQNILENDKYKIRSSVNSPDFLGDHLNSCISKNQWEATNYRDLGQSVLQIERAKFVSDSMLGIGSYVQNSPWVALNQNILENGNFKIGSDRISVAFLGNHLDSLISKDQWSVTNLSHFDKSIFQIESTGYSVKDSKSQLSSHILRSPRVGSINNPYSNGVFYTETTNYANSSSIAGVNINNFNSLVVSPNLCHAEFGMLQVKKTEYPWLASNLSSETVLSGSLINNSILGANISRTSIIDYNDNGLFTSAQPFRVYEPLDNYTLSTLKNTIESTIQKFKDHNPIQKFSLGFEKGKQITVINIIIVQGDVVGDNHHFGDNNYYLNQ